MQLFKTTLLVAIVTALFINPAAAQELLPCGIYQMEQQQQLRHPNLAIDRAKLEAFTQQFIKKQSQQNTTSGTILYTIPVVFHIIHNYGYENISKAQVLDAVRIINEDFQKLNADTIEVADVFKPLVADCQIEFKLAQLDPSGNCTDGITRTVTPLTYSADDNVKYLIAWPNDMYLNIWVVKNISFGAAGYAYYPGIGSPEDGIVIMDSYTGSIGTSPGTSYNRHSLSHEIGHYINLRHTWGNSNDPGDPANCNDDDLVGDTPNTIGVSNFACDTALHTCGEIMPDNVQNYMDYSSCHNMFTPGQRTRAHAALNSGTSGRNNLWSASNLIATGTNPGFTPAACNLNPDFYPAGKGVCQGSTVTFKDLSWNANTGYTRLWSFPGGTPATSTDSVPVITYSTPGVYDVSLALTNAAGTFTLNRTQHVTVTPSAGTGALPYSEGFEAITFPAVNWTIENDGGPAWETTTAAAATGSKSMRVLNGITNPAGLHDAFITEGINLSGITAPVFTFKVAFATKANSSDVLKVFASNNCGHSWTLRYLKQGAALATAGNVNGNFVPTANQWRTESVPVTVFQGSPGVRFKFEFTNNGGNNIYVDDINIGGTPVGIEQLNAAALQLNLQPNPAKSQTTLTYTLAKNEDVKIELCDMVGKQIQQIENSLQPAGEHRITIQKPLAGMFLLKMIVGDKLVVQKVIFE